MRQRGFTLLEMMLVVLLAGVSATLVMMAFPQQKPRDAQWQMARFRAQLERAVADSQQNDRVLGFYLAPRGWQLAVLEPANASAPEAYQWQPSSSLITLPADIRLAFTAQWKDGEVDQGVTSKQASPTVLILPGGEITPFRLEFQPGEGDGAWLEVDGNGAIHSSSPEGDAR
ncbi:type II secretion system minor pseudopilin GspH [Lonsdalea quercina]|uniref:Type II secretion system protein H n=1 Tax=Lonsdalea quercina TaxID=71657 RepID=A0A1H3ZTX8_9GAMM|nr:type II secretion system minor pseudopilin GspH [Lonsdalea quercina]SEA27085.1 general secretion pathway protein H [Lonsdalea quercina]